MPLKAIVALLLTGLVAIVPASGQKWTLDEGDPVPSTITGFDRDGNAAQFNFLTQGRPTVVYVISPFSTYVVENESRFASLMKQAGSRYSWLVLSPNEPRFQEYLDRISSSLPPIFKAITAIPPDTKKTMMLGGYPQTLVVSTKAVVIRNFSGAYTAGSTSAQPARIQDFFKVVLPKAP